MNESMKCHWVTWVWLDDMLISVQ